MTLLDSYLNTNLGMRGRRDGGRGGAEGVILPQPGWFYLSNSETVKAVTLVFCSIQNHFIRDIRAKFRISNSLQSPDIGQNSDGGISDFRTLGQSLIKESCHNSRTSDNTDMKLGPVIKLDNRNKTTSKNLEITSSRQIVTSLSLFRFMANLEQSRSQIPDA